MENNIVWCNGTFDILHPGHIELFKVGASLGKKLIVATDTDEKIRKDKGAFKPINNLCDRISMLQAIKYIDEVLYFNTREELEGLIKLYMPDILLLGDDWQGGDVVGKEYARQIRFLPRLNYSTTEIITKIRGRTI
jgi:D-beta-D-heptose 7-phosphate kinase/D-beta-D-heptose 1-phosphate adenosyltransferase|tara:strand:+ start:302 stop:709 length:408 start_codon:yes stop_codon:yes gene_type:complete